VRKFQSYIWKLICVSVASQLFLAGANSEQLILTIAQSTSPKLATQNSLPVKNKNKPVNWKSPSNSMISAKKKRSGKFASFPSRGSPSKTRGGGVHGPCPAIALKESSLTALIPTVQVDGIPVAYGATISARPTFWFYIPYAYQSRLPAEFVLIDEQEENVFNPIEVELIDVPGIIQITLPASSADLESGKVYRWVFSIMCDRTNRSGDVSVNGWIERIVPDQALQSKLHSEVTASQRLSTYKENGIWFNTLETVIKILQEPQKISKGIEKWQNLLNSIGEQDLAEKKLSACCKPHNPLSK
jgi:Domain of Unknown Function (DUF928)